MAINKITAPIQPPASDADWSNTQDLIEALALGVEGPLRIIGSNVVRGAVFNVGGSVYIADANTAITGTPSKYVKITPSGASATASYVSSLTGVTWNSTYNGYYDGSGNLYVFDELLAYTMGVISTVYGNRNFNPSTMDRLGLGFSCSAGSAATALGHNSDAPGTGSIAAGRENIASATSAVAVGKGNTATAIESTAVGVGNESNVKTASSFGHSNVASNGYTIAAGYGNTASGGYSTAVGNSNSASNTGATSVGRGNAASGVDSLAVGYSNTASSSRSTAVGYNNSANTGVNASAIGYSNTASGFSSSAVGHNNRASRDNSSAVGRGNTASRDNSSAVGHRNTASGDASSAVGYNNTASGVSSSAVGRGNNASGDYSSAVGRGNNASGANSFAAGNGQTCNTAWETAINKIRYVEFPAGTTYGDIFTKLHALLGSPTVTKHTSVIGDFGAAKLNYLICLSPSIQIYYGTTDNSIIVSSGSVTTITEGIYMLLVTK